MAEYINGVKQECLMDRSVDIKYQQTDIVNVDEANVDFNAFGNGIGSRILPANVVHKGDRLDIRFTGVISTDNTADTLADLSFKIGNQVLIDSQAIYDRSLIGVPFKLYLSCFAENVVNNIVTYRVEYSSIIYGAKNSISDVRGRADMNTGTFDNSTNKEIVLNYKLSRVTVDTHLCICGSLIKLLCIK